jgi:xylan 1,4-beta-xylosidase
MIGISNPIIPGFNPDPSFVRVEGDYYIATSTFEWFPGVQLHHSRDLVHWRLIGHALTRTTQLDLRGVANSGGVWAPSLSYCEGQFWLIYTNVRTCGMGRPFKDVGIYLTTAASISGPWSEPVFLNAIGFDPSLFHDDDGRKWLVNMVWDFRPGRPRFGGIVIQEYDPLAQRLVGPMTNILDKTGILIEGPNLYKHGGWYYLMLAEGGTGWNHGISMARSRRLLGPYELDPQAAVLTSRDDEWNPLQKAGHGELAQTPAGEWYLAHLASRPLGQGDARRCILGRETCLQKIEWSPDGWLRLSDGGWHPRTSWPARLRQRRVGRKLEHLAGSGRCILAGPARASRLAAVTGAGEPAFPLRAEPGGAAFANGAGHRGDVPGLRPGQFHADGGADLLV